MFHCQSKALKSTKIWILICPVSRISQSITCLRILVEFLMLNNLNKRMLQSKTHSKEKNFDFQVKRLRLKRLRLQVRNDISLKESMIKSLKFLRSIWIRSSISKSSFTLIILIPKVERFQLNFQSIRLILLKNLLKKKMQSFCLMKLQVLITSLSITQRKIQIWYLIQVSSMICQIKAILRINQIRVIKTDQNCQNIKSRLSLRMIQNQTMNTLSLKELESKKLLVILILTIFQNNKMDYSKTLMNQALNFKKSILNLPLLRANYWSTPLYLNHLWQNIKEAFRIEDKFPKKTNLSEPLLINKDESKSNFIKFNSSQAKISKSFLQMSFSKLRTRTSLKIWTNRIFQTSQKSIDQKFQTQQVFNQEKPMKIKLILQLDKRIQNPEDFKIKFTERKLTVMSRSLKW